MDNARLDALARRFLSASPRRSIVRLLAGSALGGALASATPLASAAKKARRNCKSCRKRKQQTCKNRKTPNLGVGTICDEGNCIPGTTAICSTNNDFCAQQWAYCLEAPECGCFMTVENDPICGNTEDFTGCPLDDQCSSSAGCPGATNFCVSLPCCPEGKTACRPLCVS